MGLPPLTTTQEALWHQNRQPVLYVSLSIGLVLNNLVVVGRLISHYHDHYQHRRFSIRHVLIEDPLMLLSAIFVDVIIGNLFAATYYGLGLHSWRINAEDPHYPRNLSKTFEYVWITMVFTGPTFTLIKLTILFFYRRLFLINQKWLKIAWWINLVYVVLWFFGATGFYLFQCKPVQWYFMRYYARYDVAPPYPIEGQCNATTVQHVAIPLILGLVSDVAILMLPAFTIWQLQMSRKAKIGLVGVFSIGALACVLDMVRIIELMVDTDDQVDPSYGVVIFLVLSAVTEVVAVICACLPVIVPALYRYHKRRSVVPLSYADEVSRRCSAASVKRDRRSREIHLWDDSVLQTTLRGDDDASTLNDRKDTPLTHTEKASPSDSSHFTSDTEKCAQNNNRDSYIWVEHEVEITTEPREQDVGRRGIR